MKLEIKGLIVPDDDKAAYDYYGITAVCPGDVASALADAGGGRLEVEINSGGGDVFAGVEIYTALRGYPGGVRIKITGFAGSAASVVAEAGESEISPAAMFMVHNVSGDASGDYHVMDKSSETLKTANRALAGAYMAKSGMSEQEALEMMDKETWLTARQAVDKGLVDRVMFEDARPAAAGSPLLPREAIAKARGILNERRIKTAKARCALLEAGGKMYD